MSSNTLFNRAFGGFSFIKDTYARQCKLIIDYYQKSVRKSKKAWIKAQKDSDDFISNYFKDNRKRNGTN